MTGFLLVGHECAPLQRVTKSGPTAMWMGSELIVAVFCYRFRRTLRDILGKPRFTFSKRIFFSTPMKGGCERTDIWLLELLLCIFSPGKVA
jgi:hypothetical protein